MNTVTGVPYRLLLAYLGPPLKGGEEREDRRGKEGLGTQMGRRGMAWDREGEEGMRIMQRNGMGREEKGREGRKEGRKEERDDLAPKQNSCIRH
jgi:hypothetical protein